jgi:ribosome-associated protein
MKKGGIAMIELLADRSNLLDFLLDRLSDFGVENVETIDIGKKTSLADYMVVGTGRSNRHMESAMERLRLELKGQGLSTKTVEGRNSGWVILDLGTILLSIMTEEDRNKYNLEKLWKEEIW